MGGKIDTSTVINILLFCGITFNFPKIISSVNIETLCLWLCVFVFISFNLYNFDSKIKDMDNKILNFDTNFRKIESHDAEINELKVICRAIEIMLQFKISK